MRLANRTSPGRSEDCVAAQTQVVSEQASVPDGNFRINPSSRDGGALEVQTDPSVATVRPVFRSMKGCATPPNALEP